MQLEFLYLTVILHSWNFVGSQKGMCAQCVYSLDGYVHMLLTTNLFLGM